MDQILAQSAADHEGIRADMIEVRQALTRLSQQLAALETPRVPVGETDPAISPGTDQNVIGVPVAGASEPLPPEPAPPSPAPAATGAAAAPDPAAAAAEPETTEVPVEAVPTPEAVLSELHRQARADLLRGRYSQAISGFDEV